MQRVFFFFFYSSYTHADDLLSAISKTTKDFLIVLFLRRRTPPVGADLEVLGYTLLAASLMISISRWIKAAVTQETPHGSLSLSRKNFNSFFNFGKLGRALTNSHRR